MARPAPAGQGDDARGQEQHDGRNADGDKQSLAAPMGLAGRTVRSKRLVRNRLS
jgi:hypothetical protein